MILVIALVHVTIGAALILRGDRKHEADPTYAAEATSLTRVGFMVGWSIMLALAVLAAVLGGNRPGPPGPPAGGAA